MSDTPRCDKRKALIRAWLEERGIEYQEGTPAGLPTWGDLAQDLERELADAKREIDFAQATAGFVIEKAGSARVERSPRPDLLRAIRRLVLCARTSGGTAGRDEEMCAALDGVEALLPPFTPLDSASQEHSGGFVPVGDYSNEPFPASGELGSVNLGSAPKILRSAEDVLVEMQRERDNLYRCVKWYADGNHAELPDWEAPDEPNWICPPSEIETTKADHSPFDPKVGPKPPEKVLVDINESWMVEDGGIARFVLAGGVLPDDMDECEESFRLPKDAKPLAAPATSSKDQHSEVFCFDRYRDGKLMAEGARITKASDSADALDRAQAMYPGDVLVPRQTGDFL